MDKFDRMQQLHRALKQRHYPATLKVLAEELECSERTVKRCIEQLIDYYHAPIENIRGKGWFYADTSDSFELPGLWLTTRELLGLASLVSVLDDLDSDLLGTEIDAIRSLIEDLLKRQKLPTDLFKSRITIVPTIKHRYNNHSLEQVSQSLIKNRRLLLNYQSYKGQKTQRELSPIKLVYYKESWYLDAYCHLRKDLRTFRLSRTISAQIGNKPAKSIPKQRQQAHFRSSYGIFAGKAQRVALLQFNGPAAREAMLRQWHPQQLESWRGDYYILQIPFQKDHELIRDILMYGADVEVIKPAALRRKVARIAADIVGNYTGNAIYI